MINSPYFELGAFSNVDNKTDKELVFESHFGFICSMYDSYILAISISDQIHNMNCYVRDFYFFRRNFYPQLSLVHMNPEEASNKLQHQVSQGQF